MDDSLNTTTEATTEMDQVAEVPTEGSQINSETDKWKSLSRANEARWKAASAELEAAMAKSAELEQALADTRRDHALTLADTHLQHAAQQRGMKLPPEAVSKLNMSAFLTEEGTADLDSINEFVSSLGAAAKKPTFAQNVGIGPQGGTDTPPERPVPLDARARR
ncbi:hypothetical protein [Nonomuraea roseoviolacea]|uniref:Scaffolding protein n=1 Tax=Nonomuraea roseoviolacea subsp. carminata TaxID=160689 RepID=A0ABT1KFD0_9ACTN|nr:hypothetical protein [Nonomuraea roseoviolacea]MCP2352691.1 hypothetical protein [Nonomuraea roseoviolacea subsp. carminata]